MTKLLKLLLPLILLIGLSLGCGLSGGDAETPPQTEKTPSGEEAAEPTAEAVEPEDGGEEASLSSITEGLQDLDSYRSHLKMTFEDTTDSGTEQQVLEMDIEYVRDPFAQHVVIRSGDTDESFETVQIGDQQYIVVGEGQCISSSAGEDAMDTEFFKPEDVMGGLENAHRVRPDETINGIPCQHYAFDETSMLGGDFASAQGDVWIAVDGGYVVKYVMQAEGTDPESQQTGHIEWEYEIRDINTSITIEPPPGCEATESEFPIMADATNMTTMSGMTMYESASSFDAVLAFYQEQMPANGWSETGDSFTAPGNAMLSYTKGESTANITLSGEDGSVSVIIMSE